MFAYSYYCYCQVFKKNEIRVLTIENTMKFVDGSKPIVRFGDGELLLISGKNMSFNNYDPALAEKLKEILNNTETSFMLCIPDVFGSLKKYCKKDRILWRRELLSNRKIWTQLCKNRTFYNAFITRPYIFLKDKSNSNLVFDAWKNVFTNRNIILIEGEFSRVGLGNDLLHTAKSIKRIICPSKNAFEKYEEILATALLEDKTNLFLVSLGPTAKPLVFDLYNNNRIAIDIGHLDLEYEWFNNKTTERIIIENKHVNEINREQHFSEVKNKEYNNQIIKKII